MTHGEHWHTQSRGWGRRECLAPCHPQVEGALEAVPSPCYDQMNVSAGRSLSARPAPAPLRDLTTCGNVTNKC